MELLVTKELNKIYKHGEIEVSALKDVNISVKKGEFVVIIGESGSGKTTLLNIIGGLDYPTSGSVNIEGKGIFALNDDELTIFRRRNIGFIFQSYNLIPELTAEQNIIYPLLLDNKEVDETSLHEILKILDLEERKLHYPSQLSGGQQQRVAIGRALIMHPLLILADEPTGNLDSKNSEIIIELLRSATSLYDQTVIMITHNEKNIEIADRVFEVIDGVIIEKKVEV